MARIILITLIVISAPLGANRADAHALGAECKIRGDRVELEAYFSDDSPARHAKVAVQDQGGKSVAQGTTDNEGLWSFPVPAPGRYSVIVDAGAGHKTTVLLDIRGGSVDSRASDASEPAGGTTGPGRAEFTRTPWERILLGLVLIAALGIGLHLWLRRARVSGTRPIGAPPQGPGKES
jgi:nickel transport protein